ncbi:MAG: type II secretion system protein E [Verrucomicrobia bacterium CAG:312_58_20]|nr:MAG: type II secretion system protein E [Verrucomicrobia bacterium CAG:312_58_20]PWL68999.1 MAG: type II secretion system protein E [Verrucomicrobiota bacterium]
MTSADDFVLQLIQDKGLVPPDVVKLGREQLVSEGVSPSDIDSKLIDLLVEKRYCKYEDISYQLSQEFNIPLISLQDIRVDDKVLKLLPQETLRKYNVFPISSSGGQLELAISDPMDMDSVDDISHILNMSVDLRLASPEEIRKAIDDHFGVNAYGDMFDSELPAGGSSADTLATGNEAGVSEEEAPIIRYVHKLITEAVKRRASDIHLEPLEKRFRIRYRIDGVLIEVENPPKRLQPSIISRLKLMANISIAEKRVPQDGRIQITFNNKEIDLRVSSLPTVYGESIVMRILDKEGLRLGLPELGFFSDDQAVFERIVGMADGIFLVTGPTGSGKSTTLYSALNFLNHPDRKIITVEDPVEYQMTGINQVQVRREVGMTFAAALRSMLRQAPNIIMIGEIRDLETAEIAINASLTGHMVFSTLHTNDAPSAVTRLVDIGVKPFLVSASLRAALAQRLVRKICTNCKSVYAPDPRTLQAIGINEIEASKITFYHGDGCPKCNGIGFKGRMGIFEIFIVNEELQQMIYEGKTLVELRTKARELGMRSMREDGIRKVGGGLTTADEVLKVTMNEA